MIPDTLIEVCTFSPVVLMNWHGCVWSHSVRNCDNWLLKQCSFIRATGIEVFWIAGDSDCLQENTCKYAVIKYQKREKFI